MSTTTSTGTPTPPAAHRTASRSDAVWLRRLVVILAVGQPVSSWLFEVLSPTELTSGADISPLVPPGAWFAIWGVILVFSAAWALLQVRRSVLAEPVRGSLAVPLATTFAGFALWLAAASLGQSSPLTLIVFLVIIGGLVVAVRRAVRERAAIRTWTQVDRAVLWLLLGTYTGWTSMAFFVNVATVVQVTGAPIDGTWGTLWQVLVLLAATGVAVIIVRMTRGSIVYGLTVAYALTGVGISCATQGFPALAVTAAIGISIAVGTTVVARALRRG